MKTCKLCEEPIKPSERYHTFKSKCNVVHAHCVCIGKMQESECHIETSGDIDVSDFQFNLNYRKDEI